MSAGPTAPAWEYQIGGCDIWQVAHLCNYMAGYGWEPVQVYDGYPGQQVSQSVRDDGGPLVPALKAVQVLFRRPGGWGDDE